MNLGFVNRIFQSSIFDVIYWFFVIWNISISVTFIIIPYWMYRAGLIMGTLSLAFCMLLIAVSSFWAMEVLSRGSILYANANRQEIIHLNGENQELLVHIDSNRKFEFNELSGIILGKVAKGIFTFFNICTGFTFIFVAIITCSQSLAVNIPIETSLFRTCNSSEFDTGVMPLGRCLNWYRVMVGSFGLVATVIACLRGKDQRYMHIIFAIVRAVVMFYTVCFAIFLIDKDVPNNHTNSIEFITKFDLKQQMLGLSTYFGCIALPTFVPVFTHLVTNKKILSRVMVFSIIAILIQILLFGSVNAFAYGRNVHPNALLNLQPYTMGNHSFLLKAISHTVILYPCIDSLCCFMFGVIICSNNTFTALTGKDYTEFSNKRLYQILLFTIYLSYSVLPVILAFFITNFQMILALSGLVVVCSNVLFPGLLQVVSSYKCTKLFPQQSTRVETYNESFCKRIYNFVFKSTFPTPYSGFYSNNCTVLTITTITTVFFAVSSYFVFSKLFS